MRPRSPNAALAAIYGVLMFLIGIVGSIASQVLERRWGWIPVQVGALAFVSVTFLVHRTVRRR